MKSRYLTLGIGLSLLLVGTPLPVAAQAAVTPAAPTPTVVTTTAASLATPTLKPAAVPEAVTNFVATDILTKADILDITEHITYNFGSTAPHTIAHSIPLTFADDQGNQYRITFKFLGANENGHPLNIKPVVNSAQAQFNLPPGSGSGLRHYTLYYTLHPVVLSGDTSDLLKLTVVGLGWSVPVTQAAITLHTPGLIAKDLACTTGADATTSSNCGFQQSGATATVTTDAPLAPGDSFIVSCDFAHGSFTSYLSPYQSRVGFWLELIGVLLVAAFAIIGLVFIIRSLASRRKSRSTKTPDPTP